MKTIVTELVGFYLKMSKKFVVFHDDNAFMLSDLSTIIYIEGFN